MMDACCCWQYGVMGGGRMDGKEIGGLTKSAVGGACVGWPGILRFRL